MPKFTTETKSTPGSQETTLLGPYLIYYFRFAETAYTKPQRYFAVESNQPSVVQLDVDTKAANFTLEPVPDTHNQYFIYTSRKPGEEVYHVLTPTEKGPGKYILGFKAVSKLNPKDVTVWTAEQGARRNKFKFSAIIAAQYQKPSYWAVDQDGDKSTVTVRDLGAHVEQGEFVLEEVDLLQ